MGGDLYVDVRGVCDKAIMYCIFFLCIHVYKQLDNVIYVYKFWR
jgi:hypothetical protein